MHISFSRYNNSFLLDLRAEVNTYLLFIIENSLQLIYPIQSFSIEITFLALFKPFLSVSKSFLFLYLLSFSIVAIFRTDTAVSLFSESMSSLAQITMSPVGLSSNVCNPDSIILPLSDCLFYIVETFLSYFVVIEKIDDFPVFWSAFLHKMFNYLPTILCP